MPNETVRVTSEPRAPSEGECDRVVQLSELDPPYPPDARSTAFVAPRTLLEKSVADIWSKLLKLDQIGVDDDFFELGGTSLLLVQMVSVVVERVGVPIDIRDFSRISPIASLAELLQTTLSERSKETTHAAQSD